MLQNTQGHRLYKANSHLEIIQLLSHDEDEDTYQSQYLINQAEFDDLVRNVYLPKKNMKL